MFTNSKKNIAVALLAVCCFIFITSCNSTPEYTIIQKQVLTMHDSVMTESSKAEGIEMQFNTLLKSGFQTIKANQPGLDTTSSRKQIISLNKDLSTADDKMEDWMHAYNNNFKGKSDQETLDYFNAEKSKVVILDSLYQSGLKSSGDYLKRLNIKSQTPMSSGKMKM